MEFLPILGLSDNSKKKARYVNGQKIKRWQDSAGDAFPFTPLLNASENRIYTDVDLVNARSQNQTLYQTAKPTKASEFSDAQYFEAVENGDMETAQRIVDYLATKKGYASMDDYRLNHRAPNSHDEDVTINLAPEETEKRALKTIDAMLEDNEGSSLFCDNEKSSETTLKIPHFRQERIRLERRAHPVPVGPKGFGEN